MLPKSLVLICRTASIVCNMRSPTICAHRLSFFFIWAVFVWMSFTTHNTFFFFGTVQCLMSETLALETLEDRGCCLKLLTIRTLAWEVTEFGNFILITTIHLWNQPLENSMSSSPLGCDFVTSLLTDALKKTSTKSLFVGKKRMSSKPLTNRNKYKRIKTYMAVYSCIYFCFCFQTFVQIFGYNGVDILAVEVAERKENFIVQVKN